MSTLNETFKPFEPSNYLNSVEDVAAYLEATIEEDGDDSAAIKRALGNIARSQNFSEIARQAGMSREGLYAIRGWKSKPYHDSQGLSCAGAQAPI